jgi:hypothetical protein
VNSGCALSLFRGEPNFLVPFLLICGRRRCIWEINMAPRTQVQEIERPKRVVVVRKRANGRSASRRRRASSRRSGAAQISDLERIIRDLEIRIEQLTSREGIRSTVSGATDQVTRAVGNASNHVGDLVADTLTDVADRLRSGATSVTGVAKVGTGAIQKIGSEIERRPMMTVAIALGIGFLAGLAGRARDPA